MAGRFIALEGGDGCGKSTQARLLAEHLGAALTREPGGTPAGEQMREIVLSPSTGALDLHSEVLLYAASRAEHVDKVIRPAIAAGEDVVCDRFIASSLAYQGYGRELSVDDVAWINDWGTGHLRPDLTILVDVPVEVAVARMGSELDRLEDVGEDFRRRVAEGYREMAADPSWVTVDGSGTIEDVFALVLAAYEGRLG